MKELRGRAVKIREGEYLRREAANKEYLMKLTNDGLLKNFLLEAGRFRGKGMEMTGWEEPTCQLRGHFLGHWLSAAALRFEASGDRELEAKAATIIDELALCQQENGGEWACPIPEKYLYWIGKGKQVWAPQYTIHKVFMGLVDAYRYMGNGKALEIADKLANWFDRWSAGYTKEEFNNIMDIETGGMLEIWADLYEITKDEKYIRLMERYYRERLFDPLLAGKDVLTNMHANTTIPEAMGCARAYEVTGEKKWLEIVEAYWNCAVTIRGAFATGGQTQGEIWTPPMKLKARLGDKNQEHCTVYNMMRLADFLFRQTADPTYMHYIEYNLQNGIFAQTYGPGNGLLTYFLPMKAGSRKSWAGELDSFFCCHGTMVQANAALNRYMYYQEEKELYVTMYANSQAEFAVEDTKVTLNIQQDYMNGSLMSSSQNDAFQTVNDIAAAYANKPDFKKYIITVYADNESKFALNLRIPDWIMKDAKVFVNDELVAETGVTEQMLRLERTWKNEDCVVITLPIGLRFITLPDDETMGAYRYGADVLVGITEQERVLRLDGINPVEEITPDTERQWGDFRTFYRTEHQDLGINFMKINEVGKEAYQMYFKVMK